MTSGLPCPMMATAVPPQASRMRVESERYRSFRMLRSLCEAFGLGNGGGVTFHGVGGPLRVWFLVYLQDLTIGVNGRLRNGSLSLVFTSKSCIHIIVSNSSLGLAFAASHLRSCIWGRI